MHFIDFSQHKLISNAREVKINLQSKLIAMERNLRKDIGLTESSLLKRETNQINSSGFYLTVV